MRSRAVKLFGWPMVLAGVAAVIAFAIAIAPQFGIQIGGLFDPAQVVLHGAVIVGLCIIAAAVIGVALQALVQEWREQGYFEETLQRASKEIASALHNKKVSVEDLLARTLEKSASEQALEAGVPIEEWLSRAVREAISEGTEQFEETKNTKNREDAKSSA